MSSSSSSPDTDTEQLPLQVGETAKAKWKGEWCSVVVRKVQGSRYQVTFSDDDSDDTTTMTRDKLRAQRRQNKQSKQQGKQDNKPAKPAKANDKVDVAAVAAPLPAVISSIASMSLQQGGQHADVIIVGAGVTGLECARVLNAAGLKCIVLEGRDRIGGRIFTDHTSFGCAVEKGAHWIHGATKKNPMKQLADELKIRRVVTKDEETLFENGKAFNSDEEDEMETQMEKLTETILRGRRGNPDCGMDRSVQAAVEKMGLTGAKKERLLRFAKNQIVSESAGDLSAISTLDWEEDEYFGDVPEEMFPGGYDQIINALAQNTDIRLKHVVTNVEHNEKGAKVKCADGSVFEGRCCLITLTVGCLQAGDIKFSPELPAAKVTAVNQLQMGVLNCLTLVFPNKFWPDDSHLWTPIDYCDVNIYDCYHCCGKPILQMHRTGSESVRWESMSDAAIAEEALDIMRKVFPRMPAPTTFAYSRWNSDPFSKGSYSFARVGGSRRSFAECGRPVGSSLYFGGEHCHKEYNATAHGSLMSGRDNAQMILKVFGK